MEEALLQLVVKVLEGNKSENVVFLDTSLFPTIFDGMVVASADNPRHSQALSRHLIKELKDNKYQIIGVEGESEGNWILVDIGDIVVHIMVDEMREQYSLEDLWRKKPDSQS
ncbi:MULTISPECIES: ribosome silencing factor [Candidatus Ichthyocystis]|uniref:ribosome silencing factor n=1 Tax=Candidatus Ichthyocystis TaxID=2929841 RepID=UPI000A7730E6|nr:MULTISPECIES: ribosome silencing factor [Ichthyocystis]